MGKSFYIAATFIFLFGMTSYSQTAAIGEDSVMVLLCHTWNIKAITLAGQPINSSGVKTTYQFHRDKTFIRVSSDKTENGSWNYDSENHLVHLKLGKNTSLYVKALKSGEFELAAEANDEPTDNIFITKIYFKIADD